MNNRMFRDGALKELASAGTYHVIRISTPVWNAVVVTEPPSWPNTSDEEETQVFFCPRRAASDSHKSFHEISYFLSEREESE